MIKRILMVTPGEFPEDIRIKKEIHSLTGIRKKVGVLTSNLKDRDTKDKYHETDIFRIKYIPWRIVGIPFGKIINHPFPFNPLWFCYIAKSCLVFKAEAIHVHDLPLVLPAIAVAKILGLKVVFDSHENYPEYLALLDQPKSWFNFLFNNPRFYKVIQKLVFMFLKDVIAVIPEMGEKLQKNGARSVFIIPNNSSKELFQKGEKSSYKVDTPLRLAYLGGLDPSRGLFELLDIMKEMKDMPVELHIAGSGVSFQNLREISDREKLKVYFYGHIKDEKLIRFLSNSHIGVIPHPKTVQWNNSNPNKLSEYACFMPIIARRVDSFEGIFSKNDMGYLFDYKNDFVNIIRNILNNPQVLYNKRINAREFVRNNLFEDIAEKVFLELY